MSLTAIKAAAVFICLGAGTASAQHMFDTHGHMNDEAYHADFIFGAPAEPTIAWAITRGGRLYDNWFATQGLDPPDGTHPAWPASNERTGDTTWRCKSCHGWDYRGAEGKYGSGSYKTGIAGVMGYQGSAAEVEALLRAAPHGFTEAMIPHEQAEYLAVFLERGLDDMNAVIDFDTGEVSGDPGNGAAIFQTTCASCHGFDGRALDWGDADAPAYVGTEANANPWEVLHKIRNGHPGVEMISLGALDLQASVDVLAYTRMLPAE